MAEKSYMKSLCEKLYYNYSDKFIRETLDDISVFTDEDGMPREDPDIFLSSLKQDGVKRSVFGIAKHVLMYLCLAYVPWFLLYNEFAYSEVSEIALVNISVIPFGIFVYIFYRSFIMAGYPDEDLVTEKRIFAGMQIGLLAGLALSAYITVIAVPRLCDFGVEDYLGPDLVMLIYVLLCLASVPGILIMAICFILQIMYGTSILAIAFIQGYGIFASMVCYAYWLRNATDIEYMPFYPPVYYLPYVFCVAISAMYYFIIRTRRRGGLGKGLDN